MNNALLFHVPLRWLADQNSSFINIKKYNVDFRNCSAQSINANLSSLYRETCSFFPACGPIHSC